MANWSFVANSWYMNDLSKKLIQSSEDYKSKVQAMYTEIENMKGSWNGEDAALYADTIGGYEKALDDVGNVLNMFGKHYENMAEATDNLCVGIIKTLNNMVDGPTNLPDVNLTKYVYMRGIEGPDAHSVTPVVPATSESVSLNSGTMVKINGKECFYFGSCRCRNGYVYNLFSDSSGAIWTLDKNSGELIAVEYERNYISDGSGSETKSGKLTIDKLANPEQLDSYYLCSTSLKFGQGEDQVSFGPSSICRNVTLSGDAVNGIEVISREIDEEYAAGITFSDTPLSFDGSVMTSLKDAQMHNGYVNNSRVYIAEGMFSFEALAGTESTGESRIVCIPQGTDVQWDPSSAPFNGYDFPTSNGPVYLKWFPDSDYEDGGYYQMVDEYENIIASAYRFTLDGFDGKHGHYK